jgi:hypothetical protein
MDYTWGDIQRHETGADFDDDDRAPTFDGPDEEEGLLSPFDDMGPDVEHVPSPAHDTWRDEEE